MDDVISVLRSSIITSKGGISIDNLNKNYRSLEGENIPFRKFGFKSLNEFLQKIPYLRIYNKSGSVYVEVMPNDSTAHLSELISRQKMTKPRKIAPLSKPRRITASSASTVLPSRRPLQSANVANKVRQDSRNNFKNPSQPSSKNGKYSGKPLESSLGSNLSRSSSNNHTLGHGNSSTMSNDMHFNNNRSKNHHSTTSSSMPSTNQLNSATTGNNSSKLSDRLIVKLPNSAIGDSVITEKRVTFAPNVKSTSSVSKSPPPPLMSSGVRKKSADPREDLIVLIEKMNLPKPEYTKKCENKKGIYCQVTIGKNKWISYPIEARSEDEAEKIAAEQALSELYKQYTQLNSAKLTTDKELIKQRLINIINIHKSGIFVDQLPFYYKNQYNEALPDNWITIAEECPTELAFDNGVANSTILVPYNPIAPQIHSARSADKTLMKKLTLPTDIDWPIYIKNFINIDEIWGVIIGENYSDQDYAMSIELMKFYQTHCERAKSIEVDNYYVVKTVDGYHRIRIDITDDINKTAEIFFIDFGDYEVVSYDQLYVLDKHFYDVPPQAIRFSLADLDDFTDIDSVKSIANNLLQDLSCYCRVTDRKKLPNDDLLITGIFYDTSRDDEQVNLNDAVMQKIIQKIDRPKFTAEGQILEVFLSHVELNHDIYVHINDDSLEIMNICIKKLLSVPFDAENNVFKLSSCDTSKIYLVLCQDSRWRRAKIIDKLTDNKCKIQLIDFGNMSTVNSAKIRNLDNSNALLERCSPLAHRIMLYNVDTLTSSTVMVDRLHELAPSPEKCVCKVIKLASKPVVELFKRNQLDNVLISINNTLVLGPAIEANEDGNNNIRPKKRLDRNARAGIINSCGTIRQDKGLGLLSKPFIPDINELFDVHVTSLVSNPYHFIVQPYNSTGLLTALMQQLNELCNHYNGPKLTENCMTPGTLCAAQYLGKWHRAYIIGTIHEQVVIYLCDTGEMTTIFSDAILPLDKMFLELPYQAIKVKLYGIKPVTTDDWSPLTSNRFKELVANKDFVSIVRNIERDENPPTKLIVTLELIDTSTDTDIKIHQVLIDENRAKELTVIKNN